MLHIRRPEALLSDGFFCIDLCCRGTLFPYQTGTPSAVDPRTEREVMTLQKLIRTRRILAAVLAVLTVLTIPVVAVQTTAEKPAVRKLEIRTYRNIPYYATFLSGESGKVVTYTLTKQPRRGTVTVDGAAFTYTPKEGKTGRDSFVCTAADGSGRILEELHVAVTIVKPKSGVEYSDTKDSAAAAAAQQLAEEGIFVGARVGEQYFFEPERPVTRSEFLAMTMETAGLPVTSVTMTGFCDDAAIPVWAKAYAAAGLSGGVVQGSRTEEGIAFRGEDPISFNEAAAVLDRVLSVGNVDLSVWYADRDAVPSWAAQAVANMESVCVLSAGSFGSSELNEPVTRADAAAMLCSAATLLAGEQTAFPGRLF